MSYTRANDILPYSLLCAVQQYIDGECMYVPRKETTRLPWGARTQTRKALQQRNREIQAKRQEGYSVAELSEHYFLSAKAIYKILKAAQGS